MKFRSVTFLIIVLLSGLSAFAQGYVEFLPDEVKGPFKERWEKIGQSRADARDEWEGDYFRDLGSTFTHILRWDKQNGFAVFQDSCSYGPRAWVNAGSSVMTTDGSILFIPDRNAESQFSLATPSGVYIPVKWGEQHWLIAKSKLRLFAYTVNSGSAFDLGNFYLRVQDREKERAGSPALPKDIMAILGMKPIRAKVISVGSESQVWDRTITIDAGSDRNVIEGMTFFLEGKKGTTVTAVVTSVSSNVSILRLNFVGFVYRGDRGDGEPVDSEGDFEPTPGLRFSSKMPDFYAGQLLD